jgi:polyvinyl alcohol dehydrogenase (cytochrome)
MSGSRSGDTAFAATGGEWDVYHYDNAHTGYDPTLRTFVSISSTWTSAPLDGAVYAEPLVSHGMVFAATENNTIYALNEATGATVWRLHLAKPVSASALPCGNISPVVGITGTPVIDAVKGVIYAVGMVDRGGGKFQYQLFTVSLSGSRLVPPRSVTPAAMDPLAEGQRSALAIGNGFVYVAFGGRYGDCGSYHPIVVASPIGGTGFIKYSPQTTGMNEAGIWGASGIAEDSLGNLYVSTGNGSQLDCTKPWDFSEAVIRLSPRLRQLTFGVPHDWCAMNAADADVGSLGPTLIDGGKKVFQAGKTGEGWVRTASSLGGIDLATTSGQACSGTGVFGGAAYFAPDVLVPCDGVGLAALKVDNPSQPPLSHDWSSQTTFNPGPPIVAGGAVWSIQVGGGRLYGFNPATGAQTFSLAIGPANHFATPSADGNELFLPLANSIEGVAFVTA